MKECERIEREFAGQSGITYYRKDFDEYFPYNYDDYDEDDEDDYNDDDDYKNNHEGSKLYNLMADFEEAAECERLQEEVDYWKTRHLDELNGKKQSLEKKLRDGQEALKSAEQKMKKAVLQRRVDYERWKRASFKYAVFAVLLIPIVALLLWVFINFCKGDIGGTWDFFWVLIVGFGTAIGVIAGIIGFGVCVYWAHDKPRDSIDEYAKPKKEEEALCDTLRQDINKIKLSIQDMIREIQECERKAQWGQENASQYAKSIAETVKNCHLEVTKIKQKSNGVYAVLRDQFAKELDERDWQHVDLIIYYYETGRAFNKQEALQLTDREIQTDRIIKSIGVATKYICKTIHSGFSQVSRQLSTISDSLIRISAHVGNISDELVKLNDVQRDHLNEMEKQSAQMNEYTEQINELVKAENLSNALQKKANESSKQLMEDVQFFRDYIS